MCSTTDGGVWNMHFLYGPTRLSFYQPIFCHLIIVASSTSVHSTLATGVDILAQDLLASELNISSSAVDVTIHCQLPRTSNSNTGTHALPDMYTLALQ